MNSCWADDRSAMLYLGNTCCGTSFKCQYVNSTVFQVSLSSIQCRIVSYRYPAKLEMLLFSTLLEGRR
eukprot:m.41477 g.41477  ORF g.41477 m.41477 type:complete len:68 (-) comp12835_c0_seq1:857-1060(-)